MCSTTFKCFYFIIISTGLVASDSPLRQLHVVFRHGERTPLETYKNDPHANVTWSGGWGQLTNRGKLEMYSLGLKLRELYGDFIPQRYFPEDVNLTSSYADRCLMSAEVLMAALFPPKDEQVWNENLLWQPIPVHYTPRSQDNLIVMKTTCKKYDEEFTRILASGDIKKIDEENVKLYEYLGKHSGEKIDSIASVEKLYNVLEIEVIHNLTLPSWTQNISLDHMKSLAARYLQAFTETDFMKRMKGGVFLKHVISSMENIEKNPPLFLYAAHDLSLINILNTLGYPPGLKPGFGASLIIKLLNSTEVLMEYRDDVESDTELVSLEECPTPCMLSDFKKALGLFLPVDWDVECGH